MRRDLSMLRVVVAGLLGASPLACTSPSGRAVAEAPRARSGEVAIVHPASRHEAPRVAAPGLDARAVSGAGASRPRRDEAGPSEPDPFPVLHTEALGPFFVGMAKDAVLRIAPGLRQQGPVIEEGATGEWVELWVDPSEGLSVGLSAQSEHGPRLVRSVEVAAPSRLATRRNVALGATYEGVRAEYHDVLDADFPPTSRTIIAGSLYGGLVFRFEAGVVESIFLGAAAE